MDSVQVQILFLQLYTANFSFYTEKNNSSWNVSSYKQLLLLKKKLSKT